MICGGRFLLSRLIDAGGAESEHHCGGLIANATPLNATLVGDYFIVNAYASEAIS